MLDPRDKLALKETFARLEYYAETLSGDELVNLSRQLNDKLLFVRRRMAELGVGNRKVLQIATVAAKITRN